MTPVAHSLPTTPPNASPGRPLRVAWFSHFPIEWLPDLPPELQGIPLMHPATWQRVLWEEFANWPNLDLHMIALRNTFPRSHTFSRGNTTFHCIRTPPGTRSPSLFWMDTFLVRRVLRTINPDLAHAWGSEFGSAAVAGRLNYPALVTMQGILSWYGSVFPLNRHMKLSRWLEDRSLRRAKLVTCESSFGKGYLQERHPHLKILQVEHAPHPRFSAVRREPQVSPARILCVGSFLYWKGADIVMKALDRLREREFELIWVGAKSPELEAQLRAETSPEIWKRVRFQHDLTPAQVADELARATFLVHASRADNSPNSVKEAVVAGVPVIATKTGGIPDYVVPGQNGFLFESGNLAHCEEMLRAALQHPDFSKGLVNTSTLEQMRNYLSATTMGKNFFAAYQTALQKTVQGHGNKNAH